MSEIFNTVCYTLADALIWFVLGTVFGLKVLAKGDRDT